MLQKINQYATSLAEVKVGQKLSQCHKCTSQYLRWFNDPILSFHYFHETKSKGRQST
jgi:hypothetical protein